MKASNPTDNKRPKNYEEKVVIEGDFLGIVNALVKKRKKVTLKSLQEDRKKAKQNNESKS